MIKQTIRIRPMLKLWFFAIAMTPVSFLVKSYGIWLIFPHIHGLEFRGGLPQAMLVTFVIWLIETLFTWFLVLLAMILFLPLLQKLSPVTAERCRLYILQRSHRRQKNGPLPQFVTGQLTRYDYMRSQISRFCYSILFKTSIFMPIALVLSGRMVPTVIFFHSYAASVKASALLVFIEAIFALLITECARLLNMKGNIDRAADSPQRQSTNKADTIADLENLIAEERNRSIGPSDLEICLNPEDAASYNNRGKAYRANSDFQSAIDDFTRAVKIDSRFAEAYCNRGEALGKIRLPQLANLDFEQGCRLYLEQGKQEEFQSATTKLKAMKSELSSTTRGWRQSISAITAIFRPEVLNQSPKAEPFLGVKSADTEDEASLTKQAKILFQDGKHREALVSYDRALALNPYCAKLFCARGDTYLKLLKPKEAVENFKRALVLDPYDTWTYISLALAYCELGEPQAAIDQLGVGMKICHTQRRRLNQIRGNVFIFMNKYEDAIEDFDKFISTWELSTRFWDMIPLPLFRTLSNLMKMELVGAYRERGSAFDKLGNIDRAASDFSKALQLENKLSQNRH